MRAFCLVCHDLPARWEVTKRHLAANGVTAEPFYGPSARRFGIAPKHPKVHAPAWVQEMSPGHLACTFGHYMLWRALQYMPQDETLVFEDDVVLSDRFLWKLDIIKSYLPDDWDFVQVGHLGHRGFIPVHGPLGKVTGWHPFGTQCYMISRKGVNYLCEHIDNLRLPIDVLLGMDHWPKMQYFCTQETIAHQRSTMKEWPSTTHGDDKW